VEREAKDHSPLTENDLRNILERKNQEPPALLAGADDEVASAIPAPAELLDHAEEPLRRFDTETHALREAAIKPLSRWCCFCAELPSDSFPSRAKRSDYEAAGWLAQATAESLRRPKRSHPYGLPEGAFPPDFPRWVRALPRVCPSPTNGSMPISRNCDVLFPAHARPAASTRKEAEQSSPVFLTSSG